MASVALRHGSAKTVESDTEQAGRLFDEYAEHILGYCMRRLRSRTDAEDAVQTTFLYALRALRRGVVPECEAAWLTSIAGNVCHSQRRTLGRRGALASSPDLDRIALARPAGDEDGLLLGLKDALASIPEKQRHALVLREWQGVPSREIALRLGMSPTATHALLTRARRSLAQALTNLPRGAALGLATLVYELRGTLRGFLGGAGAAAKTVVATAVVAATVAGGVSAQRMLVAESPAQSHSVRVSTSEARLSREVTAERKAREVHPSSRAFPPRQDRVSRAVARGGVSDPMAVLPATEPGAKPLTPSREASPETETVTPDLFEEVSSSAEELLANLTEEIPTAAEELLENVPLELPPLSEIEPPTGPLAPVEDLADAIAEHELGLPEPQL